MLINDPGMFVVGITRPVELIIPVFTSPTGMICGCVVCDEEVKGSTLREEFMVTST